MSRVQQTIDELITATRILVGEGILDGFGHVSARHPDVPDRYLMVRSNLAGEPTEGRVIELDADSNPVRPDSGRPSIERFIHGEVYRQRPDVLAIVHTHAPSLIPFGVCNVPLRPLYHMGGFLEDGPPVFDIRANHGVTNMLVTSREIGQSLATSLGSRAMVLMRGHGATVVFTSLKEAVYRAVYAAQRSAPADRDAARAADVPRPGRGEAGRRAAPRRVRSPVGVLAGEAPAGADLEGQRLSRQGCSSAPVDLVISSRKLVS
jgi:ribulose-5-phosphate 4-epimerase/fuculose-1-phosphate aldolase